MDLFKQHRLVETDEGYELILYFDSSMNDTEFAREFDRMDVDNRGRLNQNIREFVIEKYPATKINTCKIMVGSILLATILIATPVTVVQAVTAPAAGSTQASPYDYSARIAINNQVQTFTYKPFFYNNTTYASLYEFGNKLGASVWWNDTSNSVGINKNNHEIAFVRGSYVARVDGRQVTMPKSMVIDGVTYAPVRLIAENLGYQVTLDSDTSLLSVNSPSAALTQPTYTVAAGDTLWGLAQKYNTSVQNLKNLNRLTSDVIYTGQKLSLYATYSVKAGDTLYAISKIYQVSTVDLKNANHLTSDIIQIGQVLIIPGNGIVPQTQPTPPETPPTTPPTTPSKPAPVTNWPQVTYIVQPGDTATSVGSRFGVSAQDIMRFNYMAPTDYLDAGDRIAISGYAPRSYTVSSGEASAPARVGALVDWATEGQYLVKRHDTFTIMDVDTGKQFRVTMIGGYNHADIEPATSADTQVLKSLFPTWNWTPRAVVIFKDGMNIAASLSGMPHGVDTIDNGVNGHFDLYLNNSTSHSGSTSTVYIQQHLNMVSKAAGL